MQRHRHQEFIRFFNAIEVELSAGKVVHVILDNYEIHKHPKVRQWLSRHERFTFHIDDNRNRSKWLPRNVHVAIIVALEDGSHGEDPTNPASSCHHALSPSDPQAKQQADATSTTEWMM